jgi:hypothetical protein
MPINPNATHGEKVREILHSFHEKGTIGSSRPPSNRKAAAQANAIAYRTERGAKGGRVGPAITRIRAKP